VLNCFFRYFSVPTGASKKRESIASKVVYQLLNRPKRLLATLLITINFVNIAIVVFSSVIISQVFVFDSHPLAGFIIQVVAVTFVIVVFCEVLPKVYATQNAVRTAHRSAFPVFALDKILRPLSALLIRSTSFVDRRVNQKGIRCHGGRTHACYRYYSDKNTPEGEKKILKGIAKFGNIDVKQIMKPRMDVIAFDREMKFSELFRSSSSTGIRGFPCMKKHSTALWVFFTSRICCHILTSNRMKILNGKSFYGLLTLFRKQKDHDLLQEFHEKKNPPRCGNR